MLDVMFHQFPVSIEEKSIIQTNDDFEEFFDMVAIKLCLTLTFLSEFFIRYHSNIALLEIPASRVFLGANAQLLGTSLAGAKMH